MHTALTIAGSDSSAGAGVQADLKTFAAHGVYGTSAITAITVQNTLGVRESFALPPHLVVAQIEAVLDDLGADAIKIGMLATGATAEAVADVLARRGARPLVLDTVLVSTSGLPLLDASGIAVMRQRLFALATIVTANAPEAATLTGRGVVTLTQARDAALALAALGARAVVVKGGHLDGPPIDVFYDGADLVELPGERLPGRHTHGSGCTFAASIAASLAGGAPALEAVRAAKAYVRMAIADAPGLGHGAGPLEHFPKGLRWPPRA